jgi:hypothetical protein
VKRLLWLFVVLAVTGCGVRDVKYNPSHYRTTGVLAPPDVKLPAGVQAGDVVRGLHVLSADAPTEELCCWIDTHASLAVAKAPLQTSLHIGAYVPEVQAFKSHAQKVTVTFPNGRTISVPPMKPGMNAKVVAVPPQIVRESGPVQLRLSVAYPYFPGGAASKPYGVLLLSLYFE